MGDGVDCPKIRSDDGTETPVSNLAPGIAIGDRAEVTRYHGGHGEMPRHGTFR